MTRPVPVPALGLVAALALLGVSGCATVGPESWRLDPISYDNRLEDEDVPQLIDVTYPMRLVPDTAGGVWGESAGSWLHLDADGTTLRRFNLGIDEGPRGPLHGLAALTPELLVVSAVAEDADGGIHLFDTTTGSWQTIRRESAIFGDIAVHDDQVYVVAFDTQRACSPCVGSISRRARNPRP